MYALIAIPVALIAVPTALFWLGRLFAGFPRLEIRQIMGVVLLSGWLVAMVTVSPNYRERPAFMLFITATALVLSFLILWRAEFTTLMEMGDSDFPGRHDKLCWFVVLTAFAPAGVWAFREYRKAHWPDPAPFDVRRDLLGDPLGKPGSARVQSKTEPTA